MRLLRGLLDNAEEASSKRVYAQLCSSWANFTTGIQLNAICQVCESPYFPRIAGIQLTPPETPELLRRLSRSSRRMSDC
jgi:hypothetical protein